MERSKKLLCCLGVMTSFVSCSVTAQDAAPRYPSKTVVLVTGTAAGGSADLEARLYAKKLQESLGRTFLVDAKPGASGRLGAAFVAKAPPDGYTLLMVTSSFTLAPAVFKSLPYDPIRDFAPVSLMTKRKTLILARLDFPARNIKEYIDYARANPGKVNFATAGIGNIVHLAGAWLHGATGTKVTFVPYKGTAMLLDIMAGRADVFLESFLVGLPLIKSGKVKALGLSSLERSPILPDLQTVAEQTGIADFEYPSWLGIAAPAHTPGPVISKLSEELAKVAKDPEIVQRLANEQGSLIVGSTPELFRSHLTTEINRWQKLVKEIGIKLEE